MKIIKRVIMGLLHTFVIEGKKARLVRIEAR